MKFNIIPRDGKPGAWQREAAAFDAEAPGIYELHAMEYADVCEGETLTAKCAFCADASPLLSGIVGLMNCAGSVTLGELQQYMCKNINGMDDLLQSCVVTDTEYEELPLWIDEHSFNEYTGEHRGEYRPFYNAEKNNK